MRDSQRQKIMLQVVTAATCILGKIAVSEKHHFIELERTLRLFFLLLLEIKGVFSF